MEQITKQFGTGSIMRYGDSALQQMKIDVIPTGSICPGYSSWVSAACPGAGLSKFMVRKLPAKRLFVFTSLPKLKKWAVRLLSLMPSTPLIRSGPKALVLISMICLSPNPIPVSRLLEITETLIRSGGVDVLGSRFSSRS
jgi:hypothetical protein